ncbi:hypothetical protein AgCh_012191 [Apium graveolens]
MKKLASLIDHPMSHDGSPNEGIVNKGVGFASGGAIIGKEDGFAPNSHVTRSLPDVEPQLILNKKKCSQSANTGKKDAPNSQVSRITVDKAGDTFQPQMMRFRSPAENVMIHSGQAVPAPNSQISRTTVDKASDTFQPQMRRFRSRAENVMSYPGQAVPQLFPESLQKLNLDSVFPLN